MKRPLDPTGVRCPICGSELISGRCSRCADRLVFRIVRRDVAFVILLAVSTIPIFLFTRAMAARNRAMNVEIAAQWYQRGQQLRSEEHMSELQSHSFIS